MVDQEKRKLLEDYNKMTMASANPEQMDINSDLTNEYHKQRNLMLISKTELENMR